MRISNPLRFAVVLVLASIVLWNLSWSLTRVHGSLRREAPSTLSALGQSSADSYLAD